MKIAIRDTLVIESLRLMGAVTKNEDELAVHAALALFVVQELTGLDDLDDLRGQLTDEIERIIATLEALT